MSEEIQTFGKGDAVAEGLEMRNLGQDCSSWLEGECLLVCVTLAMSCRRERLG